LTASDNITAWSLERSRGNQFDLLRVLLAVLVVYSHSFVLLLAPANASRSETFLRLTRGQITGGELAVDGFFAISGLLILHSWMRSRTLWHYLQKRVLRVYPGYLLAAALCALLFGPLGAPQPSRYFATLDLPRLLVSTLHLTSIWVPGVFPHNPMPGSINGSSWSIIYEFWCYLMVAALGLARLYRKPLLLPLLFAASLATYAAQLSHVGRFCQMSPFFHHIPIPCAGPWPRLLSFFLAGMTFCLYRHRIPYSRRLLNFSLAAILILSFAGTGLAAALPLFGTYTLFYFAFIPQTGVQNFAQRPDLSYGIYLYAFPIQQLLVMHAGSHLNPYSLFLISLTFTLGFALLSWHWVEKPGLQLRTRRILAPDPRPREKSTVPAAERS
jgi:peptidoglycan/LPS O-acetylase OafA/YrhL